MTYKQLIKHFKTQKAAAAALATTKQRVHNWKIRGIPDAVQVEIESMTGGKLKASK